MKETLSVSLSHGSDITHTYSFSIERESASEKEREERIRANDVTVARKRYRT